jgi:hypothetical protein
LTNPSTPNPFPTPTAGIDVPRGKCINRCGKPIDPNPCPHGGPRLACSLKCFKNFEKQSWSHLSTSTSEALLNTVISRRVDIYVHAVWNLEGHPRTL